MSGDYKYWAFISYSHQDRRWGEWLHRALESYRVPKRLVGRPSPHGPIPRRLFPICRDRDELPSSADLGAEIQRALEQSRCQIVICSPQAATSQWVNQEIKYFKSLGREDSVLCFIVSGEPSSGDARECFAPALRFRTRADGAPSNAPAEPIAADAREQGDGRRNAKLKLIAGMLGLGFDELRQRDLQARHRRQAFLTALASAIAAVTVVLAINAQFARRAAEHSRQQAEDLISFMLGDLRAKLEPVGRLDVLDVVGEKAMTYFAELDQNGQTDAALAARAKALRQIGDIRVQQGRLQDAAKSFEAALLLDTELVQRNPHDTGAIFNLGQSEYWIGFAAWRAGDLDTAQRHLEAYRDSGRRLLELEPGKPEWLQEVGYGESNLGTLAEARSQLDRALVHFEVASKILADLAARFPDNVQRQVDHSESLGWRAVVLEKLARSGEARALRLQQVNIQQSLIARDPQDMTLKYRYVLPLEHLLALQARIGDMTAYDARSEEVLRLSRELVAHDGGNLDWRVSLQMAWVQKAQGQELKGQLPQALLSAHSALQEAAACYGADPSQSRWRFKYVVAANLVSELALSLDNYDEAATAMAIVGAAAAPAPSTVADELEATVTRALLQLELKHRRIGAAADADDEDHSLTAWLKALDRQAPTAAAVARLRLAVLSGKARTALAIPPALPRCGLEYRRLLRFLSRSGGSVTDAAARSCPVPPPST